MNIGELCNRDVVTCTPELSLVEAAQWMRDYHVGCLVVVDPDDDDDPVGILTDRDLVVDGIAALPGEKIAEIPVAQLMTCELVTTRELESVAIALERMRSFGIRRMPVVDEAGRLQGIIAYDDLIEWAAEQLGGLTRVVRAERKIEERRFSTPPPLGGPPGHQRQP